MSLSAGLYQVIRPTGSNTLAVDPVESWQVTYKYINDSTSTETIYKYPCYPNSPYSNVTKLLNTIVEQMIANDPDLTSKKQVDTVIRFIDLSLFKKIGDNEPSRLYETGSNKITITIEVPEDMRSEKNDREYKVIRVHYSEGSTTPLTEFIDAEYDSANYTLTFETDKFSTYAIAYAEPNGAEINSPVTGDYSQPVLWMILQLCSMVMVRLFFTALVSFYKRSWKLITSILLHHIVNLSK